MKLILIFTLAGLLLGLIGNILKGICFIFKQNPITVILTDLIFVFIAGILFVLVTNVFNLGIIRIYLCIFYAIGYILEQKTLGKLFAKLFLMLYNWAIKLVTVFKTTRFGKIIFK